MGARLIGEAFVLGTRHDLTGNETRVLLWMALHALDTADRPRYFMAREGTAQALGYMVPDEPDPALADHDDIARQRAAAFRRVTEAITGLSRHGAIRLSYGGYGRKRAEYDLTLRPVENCPECERKRDGNRPPSRDGNRPPQTTETVPTGRRKPSTQGGREEP